MIYTKQQLEEFLVALDSELASPATIIVIGGAAATLHYQSKTGTVDIDTYNSIQDVRDAYERIRERYPNLKIPLAAAGPAFGPMNLEKRLEVYVALPLKNLKVLIPEVHDWVLLKTARCESKDITDIQDVVNRQKVDADTLLGRFAEEMVPFSPGNDSDLVSGYLYMTSVVFGEAVAERHQALLKL